MHCKRIKTIKYYHIAPRNEAQSFNKHVQLYGYVVYRYLVRGGKRHIFPDFYTFTHMGFNSSIIEKVSDNIINEIPLGEPLKNIPVFRPEDFMYHEVCDDANGLVNSMGVVANIGNLYRFARVYKRIQAKQSIDILLLGGSITAGGYFMEFVRLLKIESKLNVTYHNHGHGATGILCKSTPNPTSI